MRIRLQIPALVLALLAACGGRRDPAAISVADYLDQVKYILQEMRSMEAEINQAVPSDSVAIEVIAPLIDQRFAPKLKQLIAQTESLQTTPDLEASHQLLEEYLRLRLAAFEAVMEGVRRQDPERIAEFGARLAEAETTGRALELAIERLRQSLGSS